MVCLVLFGTGQRVVYLKLTAGFGENDGGNSNDNDRKKQLKLRRPMVYAKQNTT